MLHHAIICPHGLHFQKDSPLFYKEFHLLLLPCLKQEFLHGVLFRHRIPCLHGISCVRGRPPVPEIGKSPVRFPVSVIIPGKNTDKSRRIKKITGFLPMFLCQSCKLRKGFYTAHGRIQYAVLHSYHKGQIILPMIAYHIKAALYNIAFFKHLAMKTEENLRFRT